MPSITALHPHKRLSVMMHDWRRSVHRSWNMRSLRTACLCLAYVTSVAVIASSVFGAEFHLHDGDNLEGEVIYANSNTAGIVPEQAESGVRLIPRSTINAVEVRTGRRSATQGQLHACEDRICPIAHGNNLTRVRDGQLIAITPLQTGIGELSDPTDEPTAADASLLLETDDRNGAGDAEVSKQRLMIDVQAPPVREGDRALLFGITLSRSAPASVVVLFSTLDGTAIAGEDYLQQAGVIILQPGDSTAAQAIMLVDDRVAEEDEQFKLRFSVDPNVSELSRTYVTATIKDDD